MNSTIEIRELETEDTSRLQRRSSVTLADPLVVDRIKANPVQAHPMFSDSLLQYEGQKGRRALATFLSFILQCLMLCTLLLLPLYFTEQLPSVQLLTLLVAPPPPPPPPPPPAAPAARVVKPIQTDMLSGGQLRTPTKIPDKVQIFKEEEAPPPMPSGGGVVGGVPGGIPGGQLGGVIGGIVGATSSVAVAPKFQPVVPQRVRVSQGITRGMLIRRVEPPYPAIAQTARVQGDVVLQAIIDKEGNIQDLALVSGHPMLVKAALDAVRQWHYRPYLLNGQPVEVETTITVIFVMTH